MSILEVEFPVAHPEHPRFLWAHAVYDVEVPGDVGGRELEAMREDAPVLVSGQLSERLVDEDGQKGRHPAIVAALVQSGPPPDAAEPISRPPTAGS